MERRPFRPQPENPKNNAPDAGAGPIGLPPPPDPEQQPLPSAWDIIEREVRLYDPNIKGRPRWGSEERSREVEEISRLQVEQRERGTVRNNLIRALYHATLSGSGRISITPLSFRPLSLEEFQQFRSQVEPLADQQIAEELRKLEEEKQRKREEYRKRHKDDPPTLAHF
jgi:hypothetical protein